MKKLIIVAGMLVSLGVYGMACAESKDISYDGKPVTEEIHLAKGDKVTINTTVPVNTKVIIDVQPKCDCAAAGFLFESSMENVDPKRKGGFIDNMFTGANPGKVTYTFTGEYEMDATFKISPSPENQ